MGITPMCWALKSRLCTHLQPHHTKALVLGSGGAAAAVEYVLAS